MRAAEEIIHLVVFDVRSAKTLCGLRVYAFYPNTEKAVCSNSHKITIDCSPALSRMTCPECAAVLDRRADIRVTSCVE